uniref:Immunoglobulin subtype domain-containing protein n=1 Tax=Oncorhynchus kisutch TaxID=8019 RepID=A0A8C7IKK9_ONCKI
MALRTAGSVLGVFVWSVAVVLGQDGWSVKYTTQSICVLKGSTVELTCSYTYPSGYTVTTTFWFTKYNAVGLVSLSDDPDYKGRVTYRKDKENEHTLTITDLRESDSATYKFRFTDQTGKWRYTGEPGVTLSVTGTVTFYILANLESLCLSQVQLHSIYWRTWSHSVCHRYSYILYTGEPGVTLSVTGTVTFYILANLESLCLSQVQLHSIYWRTWSHSVCHRYSYIQYS